MIDGKYFNTLTKYTEIFKQSLF